MTTASTTQRRASKRDWAGLVTLSLAVLLIAVDGTVLDIALPAISQDLAPSSTQLLWIIDVYSFVLAGLLITMGTLGDRIGRRRLLLIGAAGFGAASVLAAFAVDPQMLIAARVLQGISGATLMPATLGLIRTMFTDPRQRTAAIGAWSAMAGGGAAAGPLIGGWLLEHFWWGSVFLINAPLMLVLLAFGPMLIPESRDPSPGRFDLISAALSMLTVVPIVYAVKEATVHGVSTSIMAAAVVGLVAGVIFVRRQLHSDNPLLDLGLFRRAPFTAAVLTNLLSVFALAGVLFFGSQYLQLVLGKSPLQAGLLMLPGTAMSVLTSLIAVWLVRRWQLRSVLAGGLAVSALGSAAMLLLRPDGGTTGFVVAFGLVGLGVGIALTLTSDLVVSSVPPARAGAASAVSETAYELGIALGVAVIGSVVTAIFRGHLDVSALTPHEAEIAKDTLGGAVSVAHSSGGEIGAQLLGSAQHAFVNGIGYGAAITAAILVANVALLLRVLRSDRPA